jgi:O-antigen/teichoic acid export membrane protein
MLLKNKKINRKIVDNKEHIKSSIFLFFINVSNFIFPLLLSPIIISRCGVEGFGVVTMFQSIMLFISSITEYGFNVNGTREVTINQNNKEYINRYFFTVSYAKSLLLFIALFLVLLVYFFFHKANEYSLVYITSFAILLGRAYNPLWILRAIHKMKFIFYFYVFFKILSILAVYIFLKKTEDLFLVNLSIGLSDLLTCIFATIVLVINMNWKHIVPSITEVKAEIYSGTSIFVQVLSVNANSYFNPVILGFFVDSYSLGIYCVVEKIILTIKFCAAFILQSVFPKACELSIDNKMMFNQFMKSLQIFLIIVMITMAFGLISFSDYITSYFIKTNIEACSDLLIYCAWIPLVVGLNMSPYLTFMVYKIQKPVTYVIVLSVILNVILNTILSKKFGIYGVSTGIYITELFNCISLWLLMIFIYPKINFLKNEK